jgi:hypothetical protein
MQTNRRQPLGKTTTVVPLVDAYRMPDAGALAPPRLGESPTCCAKISGIETRATASWIERIKADQTVFDDRTVLIADEAGLLSLRDMHILHGAVEKVGAKIVLVGDRRQLQAIGAGLGLDLVTRAVDAARVDTIVAR